MPAKQYNFFRVQSLIPALLAGGNWNNGANCSSQSRNANNARSNANSNYGGQGQRHGGGHLTPRLDTVPCWKPKGRRQNTQRRDYPVSSVSESGTVRKNMRRHGHLWKKIVSEENILAAFQKAAKGKSNKLNVQKFKLNLEANLQNIRQSLIDKTFRTATYFEKEIYEPKKRTIYVLPFFNRIVHHALLLVLGPIWEALFIKDSYASREGKGIHSGSNRAMEFVRRNKYCLKCDVSKFYPSIDHEILMNIIRRKIKDPDTLWLIDEIIHSYPGGKNTPIGNYTSQWFGNLYLNELDQYVKNTLRVKDYIRYCDDFILFSDDKKFLRQCADAIEIFLAEKLKLKLSKCELFPVKQGVDFLGYRHFDNYILLRKSTTKRVRKRLERLPKLYAGGKITAEQYRSSVGSTWGWLKHANTHNLVVAIQFRKLFNEVKKIV